MSRIESWNNLHHVTAYGGHILVTIGKLVSPPQVLVHPFKYVYCGKTSNSYFISKFIYQIHLRSLSTIKFRVNECSCSCCFGKMKKPSLRKSTNGWRWAWGESLQLKLSLRRVFSVENHPRERFLRLEIILDWVIMV